MKLVNSLLKYPKEIPEKHVYMFTGNKTVMRNGELIMGGGNALAFKKAYPESPIAFGNIFTLKAVNRDTVLNYFLDASRFKAGNGLLGCMFTKINPKDPSPLEMVIAAIEDLKITASTHGLNFTFHLPYPGCGLGGLNKVDLDPYVNQLPDNVYVYYVPNTKKK